MVPMELAFGILALRTRFSAARHLQVHLQAAHRRPLASRAAAFRLSMVSEAAAGLFMARAPSAHRRTPGFQGGVPPFHGFGGGGGAFHGPGSGGAPASPGFQGGGVPPFSWFRRRRRGFMAGPRRRSGVPWLPGRRRSGFPWFRRRSRRISWRRRWRLLRWTRRRRPSLNFFQAMSAMPSPKLRASRPALAGSIPAPSKAGSSAPRCSSGAPHAGSSSANTLTRATTTLPSKTSAALVARRTASAVAPGLSLGART